MRSSRTQKLATYCIIFSTLGHEARTFVKGQCVSNQLEIISVEIMKKSD